MERLTNKAWRNLDPWECCGQDNYCKRGCHDEGGCNKGCIVPKIYDKLARYEDAEEDGLLVRLLCKAGDTVYALWPVPASAKYVIYVAEVKEIRIADRMNRVLISFILEPAAFRGRRHEFFESDFGKLVFFSSAEAEAALKGAKTDG